ncbi:MAG: nucleotidyltransferase family protein, partial [Chloroflexota bacterium]|nr:nucleotidyltransferase family protein [Chloroflexota bacterium]
MGDVAAVLLAAGQSTRMGQLKALLPWRGQTLLERQVASLLEAGIAQVVVVLGHEAERLKPLVDGKRGVRVVLNPRYREGKTTSIKTGVDALPSDVEHLVLVGVDQPRSPETYRSVVQAHLRAGALITKPYYKGVGGHPPVFSRQVFGELAALREETLGLKELMRRRIEQVQKVELDTPEVLLDLNRPEDYQAAI